MHSKLVALRLAVQPQMPYLPTSGLRLSRTKLKARADDLQQSQVEIELFPLTAAGSKFEMVFWSIMLNNPEDEERLSPTEDDTVFRLTVRVVLFIADFMQ